MCASRPTEHRGRNTHGSSRQIQERGTARQGQGQRDGRQGHRQRASPPAGKADQAKAKLKQTGEKVKDASESNDHLPEESPATHHDEKERTMYIGIGTVVLILAVIILFMLLRGRRV
jgi:hypothetical protein